MLILIIPIIIILICLVGLSWFAGTDAPYVPTQQQKIKKALSLFGSLRKKNFYELGSGDGRVVLEAAKMGAHSFGVEQSWIRVLTSRKKAKNLGLSTAKFIHGDIFKKDLHSADLVFIYLLPVGIKKLETRLKKELKKGSLVITQKYHFPDWKPVKKEADFWLYKI